MSKPFRVDRATPSPVCTAHMGYLLEEMVSHLSCSLATSPEIDFDACARTPIRTHFSLSLSLSLSHTHTHARARRMGRERKSRFSVSECLPVCPLSMVHACKCTRMTKSREPPKRGPTVLTEGCAQSAAPTVVVYVVHLQGVLVCVGLGREHTHTQLES